jgi:hypothetical protein
MGVQQVKLESVRRKSGGRIHLTPRVPRSGPVTTLCGQTLEGGSYQAVEATADCANCIRRSHDQARISGAFFEQEEGSELLRLSLEQAQARRPTTAQPNREPAHSAAHERVVWPAAKPPPEVIPEQVGELTTKGFRPAGEGVWRSPAGVIVKMKRHGKEWRFEELVFEGSVLATRTHHGVTIKAGDVEVTQGSDGFDIQLRKK